MDIEEKKTRCHNVETRNPCGDTPGGCKVYSRWVYDCADCSFSYLTRPQMGINQ